MARHANQQPAASSQQPAASSQQPASGIWISLAFAAATCGGLWAVSRTRGKPDEGVSVDPAELKLGCVPCSHRTAASFLFHNDSRQDVVIVGATSSCSCIVMDKFPRTVAAHSSEPLKLIVKTGPSPCRGARVGIEFLLDRLPPVTAAIDFDGDSATASDGAAAAPNSIGPAR